VDERAIVEIDRVERPETVCKSRGEILRKLTPQRVVPAELAASRDGIPVQLVEVGTDGRRSTRRLRHVATRCGR
jgi:hypothetical protein